MVQTLRVRLEKKVARRASQPLREIGSVGTVGATGVLAGRSNASVLISTEK
jgi:hypothetical protein